MILPKPFLSIILVIGQITLLLISSKLSHDEKCKVPAVYKL
jgi:hypothetical protein